MAKYKVCYQWKGKKECVRTRKGNVRKFYSYWKASEFADNYAKRRKVKTIVKKI